MAAVGFDQLGSRGEPSVRGLMIGEAEVFGERATDGEKLRIEPPGVMVRPARGERAYVPIGVRTMVLTGLGDVSIGSICLSALAGVLATDDPALLLPPPLLLLYSIPCIVLVIPGTVVMLVNVCFGETGVTGCEEVGVTRREAGPGGRNPADNGRRDSDAGEGEEATIGDAFGTYVNCAWSGVDVRDIVNNLSSVSCASCAPLVDCANAGRVCDQINSEHICIAYSE